MDILYTIGKTILGLICVAAVLYSLNLLFSWMSKVGNVNLTRYGKTVIKPDDFDRDINQIKKVAGNVVKGAKEQFSKIQPKRKMTLAESIQALKNLEELKEKGSINENDYWRIRKQITDEL